HGGRVDAQERVAVALLAQGGRQGGDSLCSHGGGLFVAALQRRVVGIDHAREGGVGQRVLVPAANQGRVGQGGQPVEGTQHVAGRTFEQSATAKAEQGIAAEQEAMAVECDV